MTRLPFSGDTAGHYRADYLKLRSVLYDRTTGLPAFPVLFDELRGWLEERKQIGVLHIEVIDLDTVESLYGWQVFDRIVGRVATALRACMGRELPDPARLSLNGVAGDRFVVFLAAKPDGSEADPAYLAVLAAELCRRLEEDFESDDFAGLSPRLCFRAGHALLSQNPFFRFERCVYTAVDEAREYHLRREQRRELSWSEELGRIIHDAAVDTVFQPVVELGGRAVLGYEAFVRGPQDTMFEAPRAMFELSSRVGVSTDLDRMCCEAALAAFAGLVDRGKVFLNVLLETLEDDEWRTKRLPSLLASAGVSREDLVLEISERCAGADPGPFVARLQQFRGEGFGLSLDDVGTGRAGLAAIEQMRPDYVKLDVSLVRNIHENLIKQEVLQTLVQLAERIGAGVVAEGVESEAEAETLLGAGTHYAQGYLFASPAPQGSVRLKRGRKARDG